MAGTVTYNSSNDTATLTPGSALAYATTYTATVSGAKDTVGDSMPVPFTWMFTTAAGPAVSSESPCAGSHRHSGVGTGDGNVRPAGAGQHYKLHT